MEYKVIGNTTDRAARLAAITEGTSHRTLLSQSTRDAQLWPPREMALVGDIEVRGRHARPGGRMVPPAGESVSGGGLAPNGTA
jgi:class 3 adenylate cyclase